MTKKMLATTAVLLVALSTTAEGHTTVVQPADSVRPYQLWLDESKMPTPDVTVTITEMSVTDPGWPCFTYYGYEPVGCVFPAAGRIFLDPTTLAPRIRLMVLHEVGHIFDPLYLTSADHAWFADFLHFPAEPWLSFNTHETAGELFAEAYQLCARYGGIYPTAGVVDRLVIPPDQEVGTKRFKRLCRFVSNAYYR